MQGKGHAAFSGRNVQMSWCNLVLPS